MYIYKRNLHCKKNHVHFQNINSTEMSSGQGLLTKKIKIKNNLIRKAQIMYGNSALALAKKCLSKAEYAKE